MNKVNVYCDGVSVSRKTTIAVEVDMVFDPDRLRSELGGRLDKKARLEGLGVNPTHLANCEIMHHPTHVKVLLVTYPPSLPNIEEIILEVLGEIEADVKAVVEVDRLRELLVTERVVVR